MPSPNDPSANEKLHAPAPPRPESAQSSQPAQNPARQPWGIGFALFLAGFGLLVVMAKLNLSRLTADALRAVGAALCLAAFVLARRAQRTAR